MTSHLFIFLSVFHLQHYHFFFIFPATISFSIVSFEVPPLYCRLWCPSRKESSSRFWIFQFLPEMLKDGLKRSPFRFGKASKVGSLNFLWSGHWTLGSIAPSRPRKWVKWTVSVWSTRICGDWNKIFSSLFFS